MNRYLGDYKYVFETGDIENFFTVVEDYNTCDAAFKDPNQKSTLTRLREALIKYKIWEEEMLIVATMYDKFDLLNSKFEKGKISKQEFKNEIRKHCFERNDINKIMNYHYFYK